jgi:hypothetical protein
MSTLFLISCAILPFHGMGLIRREKTGLHRFKRWDILMSWVMVKESATLPVSGSVFSSVPMAR